MAEGDSSGDANPKRRETGSGAGEPAAGTSGGERHEQPDHAPEVVRPSWDHARDYPEVLAEGRTSTAVAIGLVAAALLGGGLWLAMRTPEGEPERPSAVAPTGVPEVAPTALPTWAPLDDGRGAGAPRPATTLAPVPQPDAMRPGAAATPATGADRGTGGRPGIDRPRRPRPTPSDPNRAAWRQRLERFREERRAVMRDRSLTREQRRDRMEDLLRQQFRQRNPVPPPPPDPMR